MLVGIPPFYHQNMHTMYQYITTKNIIFPDPKKYDINISETAKDLINKLLCKNHTSRLGINNDVQEILVHPFFADLDIQALYGKQVYIYIYIYYIYIYIYSLRHHSNLLSLKTNMMCLTLQKCLQRSQ